MATVDDVVKISGVSRSTVFRFLNGSNVRPDAKKAIIQAMDELNYKTDAIYKQQNILFEVSISDNFESFKGFAEIVQGIMERADEKGIKVQLVRRSGDQITAEYSRWDEGEGLKGVIVVGKSIEDEEKEKDMLVLKGIPHIFVNRFFEEPGISFVSVDLKRAAYELVSYLIQKGHKNIAICGIPGKLKVDRDKLEGYKMALQENGIKVSDLYYHEVERTEEWDSRVKTMLESDSKPSAYLGICDSYAMKFIHTARAMGCKVPEDISVVGMDDVDMAEYYRPALTTMHIPFRKMGIVAVDNLLQLLTDDEIGCIKTTIKHKLVVRESC